MKPFPAQLTGLTRRLTAFNLEHTTLVLKVVDSWLSEAGGGPIDERALCEFIGVNMSRTQQILAAVRKYKGYPEPVVTKEDE